MMTTATQKTTWQPMFFPSGTIIVISNDVNEAHLYVYGPTGTGPKDEDGDCAEAVRIRYAMCHELAEWMNGGKRPKWVDDMWRVSEYELQGGDGSSITAVGPMPYNEDEESLDKRARLIDRLTKQDHPMPISPLEAVAALRLAQATASIITEAIAKLQSGQQPTAEECEAITRARKLAKDNLLDAIDRAERK